MMLTERLFSREFSFALRHPRLLSAGVKRYC